MQGRSSLAVFAASISDVLACGMGWAINYLLLSKIFVLNEELRFGQCVLNPRLLRLGRAWM